jgi:phenylacetyl-CoA:acceptor oxidoreductase subunit 2
LPIALLIFAFWPWPWSTGLAILAGVLALAAGWLMKYVVVTRAAYNQGFALPWTPVRGAGNPVAGPRPGWPSGGEKPSVGRAGAPRRERSRID